jgi:hypothetical protein
VEPNEPYRAPDDDPQSAGHPELEHSDSQPEPGSDSNSDSNDDSEFNGDRETEHSDSRVGSDAPDPNAEHHMVEPNEPYRAPDDSLAESTGHPTLEHADSHPEPDLRPGGNEHPTAEHQDTHAGSPEARDKPNGVATWTRKKP